MTDASKKKGMKKMRKPPASTNLDKWVKGGTAEAAETSAPKKSAAKTKKSKEPAPPTGAGIVKRSDGTYKRRLVVYLTPEHAQKLKIQATINNRDMSDIVDELVGAWVASEA